MPTPQTHDEKGACGDGQDPNGDVGLSEDGRIAAVGGVESASHVGSALAVEEQRMPIKPGGCP